jgi:uncharacterized protein (TIGR02246 family)
MIARIRKGLVQVADATSTPITHAKPASPSNRRRRWRQAGSSSAGDQFWSWSGSLLGGGSNASPPKRGILEGTKAMADDESHIRALIQSWAKAVHVGDIDGVLADHADDIVMFDVPPPSDGVRGIDAYRETWPPFFIWQKRGASFEIISLEVIAGEDVAFAHALLRCGTQEELIRDPENRLRLTIGLRKESGRWLVAHEHHSFPSKD